MECPHGDPRGNNYCALCRWEIKNSLPELRVPVEQNGIRVSAGHPNTSYQAAKKALPKSGTKKKIIYDLIVESGICGLCDHEIETKTGWTHQSASAIRNTLMNDGWVLDSGFRRETPQLNPAIVWIAG